MTPTPPPDPPRLWLLTDGVPAGPFDLPAVFAQLASGAAAWHTPACAVGESAWVPLRDHPALGLAAAPDAPPPAPPVRAKPLPTDPVTLVPDPEPARERDRTDTRATDPADISAGGTLGAAARRPWNPTALGWLTLLFTPLWGGVMAAVNGRRVGHPDSVILGPVVGFGFLAVDIGVGQFVTLPYWADLLVYLAACAALAAVCFAPQAELYARIGAADYGARAGGGWGLAVLGGAPLALLAFLAYVVAPLLPAEPRQVCEEFAAAGTAKDAERVTTPGLRPALPGLFAARSAADPLELTDEAAGQDGTYLVGFATRLRTTGFPAGVAVEGAFVLGDHGGEWKVSDLVLTLAGGAAVDPPVSIGLAHQELFAPASAAVAPPASRSLPRVPVPVAGRPAVGPPAPPRLNSRAAQAGWWTPKRVTGAVGGAALAVCAAAQAAWGWATGQKKPSAPVSGGTTSGA